MISQKTNLMWRAVLLSGVLFFVPPSTYAMDRNMTTVTVTNTTTETPIYTFTVPGGVLSTRRGIRVVLWGDYLQNSGARTITFRIRYGGAGITGTVVASKVSDSMAAQATTGNFWADFYMYNTGATNSQLGSFCAIFDRAAVVVTMVGTISAAAVDSTTDQTFTITAQHSFANASITLTKLGAQASLM